MKADGVIAPAMAGTPGGRGTDLLRAAGPRAERIANLRGVVLASDGDWNEGPPPVQAAARLRIKGVPVLAVPVGSRTRLPDVELLSLDVPTFGIAGKSVRIPFTIDSSLPRDYVTTVTLKTSDGDEVTKEVADRRDGPHQRLAGLEAEGDGRLHADARRSPSTATRRSAENNTTDGADRDPRGEAAGPGGRVVSAVGVPLPAQRPVARPGRRAVVPAVPPGPEQGRAAATRTTSSSSRPGWTSCRSSTWSSWATWGSDDGQLTAEQCRLMKGLVEHQASGLVFMPGSQGRRALAAGYRAGRPLPGGARRRRSRAAGARARPTTSS